MSQSVHAGPIRLHHHAAVTDDQEATRQFYEDVIGMPLPVDHADAERISAERRRMAHQDLARWLGGDHTSNNIYR